MYEDHFTHTWKTVGNAKTIREESLRVRVLYKFWISSFTTRCIIVDGYKHFGSKYVYYRVENSRINIWSRKAGERERQWTGQIRPYIWHVTA